MKVSHLERIDWSDFSGSQEGDTVNEAFLEIMKEAEIKQIKEELEIPNIEKSIIEDYFLSGLKPGVIWKKRRIDRAKVYSIARSIKRIAFDRISGCNQKRQMKDDARVKIELDIKGFCDINRNYPYTVGDVYMYLEKKNKHYPLPSRSTIYRVMRQRLNLSHKRVSWRPLKNQQNMYTIQRGKYISFVREAAKIGWILWQIDEFSIGRNTHPNMAWCLKGQSQYCCMERSSKSYSLISGITNLGLELKTISCRSTKGQVFWEYLKLLIEVLKNNYKDQVKRVILTCDGARYHLIDQVDQILKDNGMLMVQTIPYSPEFTPIELFINAVKSIIRKRIRMSK